MLINDLKANNLNKGYELSYHNACNEFSRWDPLDMSVASGSNFDTATQTFLLNYVDEEYKIKFPSGEIEYAAKNEPVPIAVKIVLIHYLVRSSGQPLKNHWISFREIAQGGVIYFPAFNNRVIKYLLAVFSKNPLDFVNAGKFLGGTDFSCGDYGIQLKVLPHLPIVFGMWDGDEEFVPRAAVLFDATAPLYLPTEDLVVASAFCVSKLVKAGKALAIS